MKFALTGTTQVSLIGKAAATANIVSATLGGAAAGAAVAGLEGGNVGEGAWKGAAIAGGLSALTETSRFMREKMWKQSLKNPKNSSGKSGGGPWRDERKIAGSRYNKANPLGSSPAGGRQGGRGWLLGPYEPNSVRDYIAESWSGSHDFFNSWTYDSLGNIRQLNPIESVISTITNPLNIALVTPLVVAPIITLNGFTSSATIYGVSNWADWE